MKKLLMLAFLFLTGCVTTNYVTPEPVAGQAGYSQPAQADNQYYGYRCVSLDGEVTLGIALEPDTTQGSMWAGFADGSERNEDVTWRIAEDSNGAQVLQVSWTSPNASSQLDQSLGIYDDGQAGWYDHSLTSEPVSPRSRFQCTRNDG